MTDRTPDMHDDVLRREAQGWVVRLTAGDATVDDAAALKQWCAQSPGHGRALAEANLLWDSLEDAARSISINRSRNQAVRHRTPAMGRRAFVVGGLAASAAATIALAIKPPLDLWPSAADLMSDYRTRTGERQNVTIAGGVSIEMNTRTSVNVPSDSSETGRIALVSGEATIATPPHASRPVMLAAGEGTVIARQAKFNVRVLQSDVRVTCLEGEAKVNCNGRSRDIGAMQQVTYSGAAISQIVQIDPAAVTGWQQGLLLFRKEPLSLVIEEINRYRPGRIILSNDALAARRVEATVRLDRIDDIIALIRDAYGVHVRTFPGGIILLG